MTDDGGVLGNLPRSRPGRRSEKRGARPCPAEERTAPAPEERATSTAGDVVGTVAAVAGGGLRAACGIGREVIRRLPRL